MASMTPFTVAQFTATAFDSAADKAKATNDLVNFVLSDFKETKFTEAIYRTLSLHLFGHIAEYNQQGFYETWFSTHGKRLRWIQHALAYASSGSPEFTWCDAMLVFQKWLRNSHIPLRFQNKAASEQRYGVVYEATRVLAMCDACLTPSALDDYLQGIRHQVEEIARVALDGHEIVKIRERLIRELITRGKTFRVATISDTTNSFGLSRYIVVARDGEGWQLLGYRPSRGYSIGDDMAVVMHDGQPNFSALGFEMPERLVDAPQSVIDDVFGQDTKQEGGTT